MGILQKLTLENLRKNRRRTAVTILGVVLATALILAVAGMVASFQKMMMNYAIANYGDFHDMYEDVPADAIQYISGNVHVDKVYYSLPASEWGTLDEDALGWYKTYQGVVYDAEDFTTFADLVEHPSKLYNVFVRYDQPKRFSDFQENISSVLENHTGKYINVRTNSELLRYEGVLSDATLETLYWLAGIAIAIIVVTSVFVIRNSFSISATERMRQFGMLSSVGATPRQIRHSVIFEGLIIAAIGIPLGLLLGSLATAILVMIVNYLLRGMMVAEVSFSMPLLIFPLAIGLSALTVFLSSLFPALRAARLSAIEAIRSNQDVKVRRFKWLPARKARQPKLKTNRVVSRFFGIGGVIAHKNLQRSRKKYRTTVVSIVVSVAVFVGLSSFMGLMDKTVDTVYSDGSYDGRNLDLVVGNVTPEFYRDLAKRFNIKDYVYYENSSSYSHELVLVSQEFFEEYARSLGITSNFNRVAIMNDYFLARKDNGRYATQRAYGDQEGDTIEVEVGKYSLGSHIAGVDDYPEEVPTTKLNLTIAKVTDRSPAGLGSPNIVVAENFEQRAALNVTGQTTFGAFDVENLAEITAYLDEVEESEQFKYFHYMNIRESMAQNRRLQLLFGIFLYGFVIVVMLIGVTNIFNTITTNIALRAKEFATLRSVGMTGREFSRMVRLESLFYAGKALLIGLPLGILLSFGFYKALGTSIDFGYELPLGACGIAIVAVGLLIWAIMHYSVRQIAKQNIIETIREENI